MLRQHHVTAVAIGNGTASRESEAVVAELLKELPYSVAYMVVSEAGASVYSASKLAAEEFPEYDVSLRSAVSMARRVQDPLAELVKIDPQAIGVGQYQHDMPKAELSAALDGVVEDCVNHVGVDLNTASFSLLSHIAGINQTIAKNIVAYRTENGAFTDRKQLKRWQSWDPRRMNSAPDSSVFRAQRILWTTPPCIRKAMAQRSRFSGNAAFSWRTLPDRTAARSHPLPSSTVSQPLRKKSWRG